MARRLLVIVPAVVLSLIACRPEPSADSTRVKILVIGIDGATFNVIDPLLAQGELPNLGRLIANGSRGPLRSVPPTKSPAVWTTIATGHPRSRHGITDFYSSTGDGKSLVSSADRQTLAIWNILSARHMTVGVVGWWATWPAEEVEGWMVSDRMARGRWLEWVDWTTGRRLTHPESLTAELAELVVDPLQEPHPILMSLADFNQEERLMIDTATKPVPFHGPTVAQFGVAAQRSYERIALHQLGKGQPDFMALMLIAVDPISHTFWHHYRPQDFPPGFTTPEDAARLGKAIPNIYRHDDAYIGELLDRLDPNTVVMVVSDHGFHSAARPRIWTRDDAEIKGSFDERMAEALAEGHVTVGQPGHHHIDGVLIASGGPVRAGVEIADAGIMDIAPTALALMGVPVPRDMEGRVLRELVDDDYWRAHPIRFVDTYEGLIEIRRPQPDALGADEEATDMLRALGYVE